METALRQCLGAVLLSIFLLYTALHGFLSWYTEFCIRISYRNSVLHRVKSRNMQQDTVTAITRESINLAALPSLPLTQWRRLPNCAAVYFALDGENVVYIGQTLSLVLRWQQHSLPVEISEQNYDDCYCVA